MTRAIKGAVSHVARRTNLPLIVSTDRIQIVTPRDISGTDSAICFYSPYVTAVTEAVYFDTDQEFGEEPTGSIVVATLGRRAYEPPYLIDRKGWNVQYPPPDGWPDMLFKDGINQMVLTVTRDFNIDEKSESLRSAIILVARNLYLGFRDSLDGNEAFESLLFNWID